MIALDPGDSVVVRLPDGNLLTLEQTDDELLVNDDFEGTIFRHPTSGVAKVEDRYDEEGGEG